MLMDNSASGLNVRPRLAHEGSGQRTKREFAAEVAAALAISAARNGDKVALLLFTDEVELYLPPRKGRRQRKKHGRR